MRKFLLVWTVAFLSGFMAISQSVSVSGKVTSLEDGAVLPGVSILVKGTTNGTSTDADGNFKIDVPANGVLIFSFIGF